MTAMEKVKLCLLVCLDGRLRVGRGGQRKGDVRITEASVKFGCMKTLSHSDAAWPWIKVLTLVWFAESCARG